jgi:hypothetical protein
MGHQRRNPGLTRSAGAVLRADQRLVLVPLTAFSALGALAVATTALTRLTLVPRVREYGAAYRTAGFGVLDADGPPSSVTIIAPTWATFVLLVTAYVLAAFIVAQAMAVLAAAVHAGSGTPRPSLARAARTALRRSPQLLAWAVFGGVIGLAHRVIEKRAVLGAVTGRPVTSGWRRAAWLAIPVVVIEGRSPVRSLIRSAELVERTWGEDAPARTGLGTVTLALLAPGLAAAVGLAPRGAAGLAVTAALLAAGAAVVTTLSTIARATLYGDAVAAPDRDLAAVAGAAPLAACAA